MNIIEHIIRYIAPHHCVNCGKEGALMCKECATTLSTPSLTCFKCDTPTMNGVCQKCQAITDLTGVYALTLYDGVAKKLLWKLKFDRGKAAASEIAEVMLPLLNEMAPFNIVTHAPTANQRIRQRGYDQAELIARHLAQLSDVPYRCLLARTNNERQVGSTVAERNKQTQGAFRILQNVDVQNKNVLVIDDVITTGASLMAASRVLKQAGANSIQAAVFARAKRPQ